MYIVLIQINKQCLSNNDFKNNLKIEIIFSIHIRDFIL